MASTHSNLHHLQIPFCVVSPLSCQYKMAKIQKTWFSSLWFSPSPLWWALDHKDTSVTAVLHSQSVHRVVCDNERGKLGDNERQWRDGVSETFPEIHITRCSQDSRMWQCVLSAWIMQRKKQDSGASRRSLTHKHMHTLFARQAPTPGTQRPAH